MKIRHADRDSIIIQISNTELEYLTGVNTRQYGFCFDELIGNEYRLNDIENNILSINVASEVASDVAKRLRDAAGKIESLSWPLTPIRHKEFKEKK